jgi:hypothetical protein
MSIVVVAFSLQRNKKTKTRQWAIVTRHSFHIIIYYSVLGRMREYWRALQILHHKGTTSSQMGGLRITGICWYLLLSTFLAFCDDPIETYIIVSWMDGWMYVHVHVWMNFVVKLTFQHTIVFASCR